MSRDYATGWTTEESGSDSRQEHEIILFSTAFRPALGPTQAPIRRVPGALFPVIKWTGSEAD
jgi:hypothetical protein